LPGSVTVDDIVAAAGMSRRTFFRYYASKEDVVVRFLSDMAGLVLGALVDRPPAEPPSVALRAAIWAPLAEACAEIRPDHIERSRVVVRLILDTPALHARWLERQVAVRDALATALATRLGLDAEADAYPTMAAGIALLAFDTVLTRWRPGDDEAHLAALTDRAFAVAAPALDAAPS
jgi:AcrR family transcriptional regulator